MRDLLEIMWQRHSNRAPFDTKRKISEQDLQRILDAARWSPTAHNMQNFEIIVIDDAHKLTEISALPLPPSETFEVDNYRQLSFSEAELLRTKTGLFAGMFPASWHERDVEREAGTGARHSYLSRTISACAVLLLPGRRRSRNVHFRATRSRCQRNRVAEETSGSRSRSALVPISLASVARVRRSASLNKSLRRPSLDRSRRFSALRYSICATASRSSQHPMLATSNARKVRGFHDMR